jgi:hypothetical protein
MIETTETQTGPEATTQRPLLSGAKIGSASVLVCQECGVRHGVDGAEVIVLDTYWSCGGQNCFHFEWRKITEANEPLCENCENEQFWICDKCGVFVSDDCMFGAQEFDEDTGDCLGYRCPECKQLVGA